MTDFDSLVGDIGAAYRQLGHQYGWRFLMGPERTLAPHTRLAFVAHNPGGDADRQYLEAEASVERGNAYRPEIEEWLPKHRHLQVQICMLHKAVAGRVG